MDFPAELFSPHNGLTMILLAGIAIYIASRAGREALVGSGPATGWRIAFGHWIPVAVIAIWAAATDGISLQTGNGVFPTNHGTIAMGIIFGTSVGGLLLAGGAAALVAPPSVSELPRRSRLLWPMVVPVGLLALISGFKGYVTVAGALALLCEGLVVLAAFCWQTPEPIPVFADADKSSPGKRSSPEIRIIQFVLACCLATVAAWVALHGVDRQVADSSRATPGLLTSILICPLLVLPLVGTATEFAQRGRSADIIEAGVCQAVWNICLLIPLGLLASRIGYFVRNRDSALKAWKTGNIIPFKNLPFPVTVWRVDLLFILAAGLLLLPVATGRWPLSKRDGLGMTVAYGIYLFLPIYMIRISR